MSYSSNCLLDELVLQPLDLLLERLDLLPTVQRPAVVHPQACDNVLLGLGQLGIDLLQLLPLLELRAQLLNFLCDARPAHVLLALLLGEGGRGRRRVCELLGERGFRLRGLLAGQGLAELGELLRPLLAQLLELGRQALLVLQLLRLRARGICLVRVSALFYHFRRCDGRATHKGVLLQRVHQFIREADGVVSGARSAFARPACIPQPCPAIGPAEATHVEKTCCLTSEEGFEFSAPMLLRSAVRDASAMMQLPEEVGAHSLGRALRRCGAPAHYDRRGSDRRGMLEPPESCDMSSTQQRDICPHDQAAQVTAATADASAYIDITVARARYTVDPRYCFSVRP